MIPWLSMLAYASREAMRGLTQSFMGSCVQSQISARQEWASEPTPA